MLADDTDFDFLLESVSMAWANDSRHCHNGYSLGDLLQGLGNLAQNDDNKKLLMKKGETLERGMEGKEKYRHLGIKGSEEMRGERERALSCVCARE